MTNKKEITRSESDSSRRKFLKNTALLTGAAGAAFTRTSSMAVPINPTSKDLSVGDSPKGEVLYNGITLPSE